MKPWLLNILACPICKNHPLESYFFTWENSAEEISSLFKDPTITEEEIELLTREFKEDIVSPIAFKAVRDLTGNADTNRVLSEIKANLESVVENAKEKNKIDISKSKNVIKKINSYFNKLSVKEGILFCTKCKRWYPVGSSVKGIPEMLPDKLREKNKDMQFFKRWQDKLPEKIIKEGKPFIS
ncbi:MAG: Trm112 family protein [Candidatus Odinarchaeia archaeon]